MRQAGLTDRIELLLEDYRDLGGRYDKLVSIEMVEAVGAGRTHRLSGMAVIATAAYEGTVRAGLGVQRSALLDPGAPDPHGAPPSRLSGILSRGSPRTRP